MSWAPKHSLEGRAQEREEEEEEEEGQRESKKGAAEEFSFFCIPSCTQLSCLSLWYIQTCLGTRKQE